MKKIFLLFAVVCMALISCTDDIVGGGKPTANLGDEILFNGSMNYEPANKIGQTRTVYGDKVKTGTEIKWHIGDTIGIYCAEAFGDVKYCDYAVVDPFPGTGQITGNGDDDAYEECSLLPKSDNYLRWGEGNHTFYGVYPSALMLNKYGEDNAIASSLKLENGTLTASLPNIQRPGSYVTTDTDGNYKTHPAMRYAYMVATASTDPSKDASVLLQFNPIVTAVEMTLENTGTAAIEGITMVSLSSDTELCGSFTADLSSPSSPNVTLTSSGDTYKTIQIPLVEAGSSINLLPGKTITFTAFMMLNTDLSSIKFTLLYAGGIAQKQATLTGNKTDANQNGIIVKAKTKNFIKNVPLSFSNAVSTVDLSKWAASISTKDNKTLASLSIPAASGAASGHTANWNTNEKYLEQELTIEELWDNGIRCFEFTVDYKSTDADFKTQKVYCNSKPSELSLDDAVSKVKAKLIDNPTEFAMVIITYQQQSGWDLRNGSSGTVTYNRKPSDFMTRLNTFWTSVSTGTTTEKENGWGKNMVEVTVDGQSEITLGTALYSPTAKLSDARGKLFCIARPTSEYEDNYATVREVNIIIYAAVTATYGASLPTVAIPHEHIMIIDGWGALKDKWEARGYTPCLFKRGNGNADFYRALNNNYNTLGYDKSNPQPGRPFDVASSVDNLDNTLSDDYVEVRLKKDSLHSNFYYNTIVKNTDGTRKSSEDAAWIQEWARVSKGTGKVSVTYTVNNTTETKGIYWPSSVKEKQQRIEECLDFALSRKIKTGGEEIDASNVVFINSLCGFYVDTTLPDSYFPNTLTECVVSQQGLGSEVNPLTASSTFSGMCGNISDFAYDFNNYFYQYLLTKDLGGNSTGIIMMDRVSDDAVNNPAGYYIPRIILANNPFAPGQLGDGASYSIRKDQTLEEDDNWASPAQRGVKSSDEDEEISIIWH